MKLQGLVESSPSASSTALYTRIDNSAEKGKVFCLRPTKKGAEKQPSLNFDHKIRKLVAFTSF